MSLSRLHLITLLTALLLLPPLRASAQEIRCNVQINSEKIEGSNKQVFNTLQQSIEEFVNNSKWTNMTFAETEKIDCNLLIVCMSYADNMFACEATIQASRPVYNTTYNTTLLNFKDNYFNFTYQEYDQLNYQQSTFQTNLTALLAYYVYLILGFDSDSYQRLGGTSFFQACQDIAMTCQSASMESAEQTGWQSSHSSRNRYTIANNLTDEAFKPFRNYFYEYHRLGLDEMAGNVANGRARIAAGINVLKDTQQSRPSNFVVGPFLDAKADELVNIFKQGTDKEKESVYKLLMDVDPTRSNTYDEINER